MARTDRFSPEQSPLILIVPGLHNSGPNHWQSRWEAEISGSRRVELGMWDDPHRNTWVNQLNLAIHKAERPVILVAHSLGCHAVAWWAEYEQPGSGSPVVGALLVAPPEVEGRPVDHRIQRFAPLVENPLPFKSIVAASRNDPFARFNASKSIARKWGSRFGDAGLAGHINADSGIGSWHYGKFLLGQLIAQTGLKPVSNKSAVSMGSYSQSHRFDTRLLQ